MSDWKYLSGLVIILIVTVGLGYIVFRIFDIVFYVASKLSNLLFGKGK